MIWASTCKRRCAVDVNNQLQMVQAHAPPHTTFGWLPLPSQEAVHWLAPQVSVVLLQVLVSLKQCRLQGPEPQVIEASSQDFFPSHVTAHV